MKPVSPSRLWGKRVTVSVDGLRRILVRSEASTLLAASRIWLWLNVIVCLFSVSLSTGRGAAERGSLSEPDQLRSSGGREGLTALHARVCTEVFLRTPHELILSPSSALMRIFSGNAVSIEKTGYIDWVHTPGTS